MMNPKTPVQTGLEVVETKFVSLKNIHRINPDDTDALEEMKYLNVSRPKGVDPARVTQFVHLIRNGDYEIDGRVPPVVVLLENGEYRLVSGDHRYQGHEGAGKDEMFVVVAKFIETKGKSSRYWMYVWQSNENREDEKEVKKNHRDDDDVVSNVVHLCHLNEVDSSDDEDLVRVLMDQGYLRNSGKMNNMMFAVRNQLGGHVDVPHVYDADAASRYLRKRGLESDSNVVRMMKSPSGHDNDYDWRFLKDVVKKFKSGCDKVVGYLHFSGLTSDKLLKCRKVKSDDLLNDHYEHCKQFVDLYESGRLKRDYEQRYLCQFDSEKGLDYVK